MWIKENLKAGPRIISADKPEGQSLVNVTIFHLDKNFNLLEKIVSKKVQIINNEWKLNDVEIFKEINGVVESQKLDTLKNELNLQLRENNNTFKNFDTMSFLELVLNYKNLKDNGYDKHFLNQSLHTMLSMPFFLLLMTGLASILTMNTLKYSDNFKFIIIGLITSVLIFYFKDFSLALGQTGRIPLPLAIWAPVIALTFFTSIGILQINEK